MGPNCCAAGVHPRMHHNVPASVQLPVAGEEDGVYPVRTVAQSEPPRQATTLHAWYVEGYRDYGGPSCIGVVTYRGHSCTLNHRGW